MANLPPTFPPFPPQPLPKTPAPRGGNKRGNLDLNGDTKGNQAAGLGSGAAAPAKTNTTDGTTTATAVSEAESQKVKAQEEGMQAAAAAAAAAKAIEDAFNEANKVPKVPETTPGPGKNVANPAGLDLSGPGGSAKVVGEGGIGAPGNPIPADKTTVLTQNAYDAPNSKALVLDKDMLDMYIQYVTAEAEKAPATPGKDVFWNGTYSRLDLLKWFKQETPTGVNFLEFLMQVKGAAGGAYLPSDPVRMFTGAFWSSVTSNDAIAYTDYVNDIDEDLAADFQYRATSRPPEFQSLENKTSYVLTTGDKLVFSPNEYDWYQIAVLNGPNLQGTPLPPGAITDDSIVMCPTRFLFPKDWHPDMEFVTVQPGDYTEVPHANETIVKTEAFDQEWAAYKAGGGPATLPSPLDTPWSTGEKIYEKNKSWDDLLYNLKTRMANCEQLLQNNPNSNFTTKNTRINSVNQSLPLPTGVTKLSPIVTDVYGSGVENGLSGGHIQKIVLQKIVSLQDAGTWENTQEQYDEVYAQAEAEWLQHAWGPELAQFGVFNKTLQIYEDNLNTVGTGSFNLNSLAVREEIYVINQRTTSADNPNIEELKEQLKEPLRKLYFNLLPQLNKPFYDFTTNFPTPNSSKDGFGASALPIEETAQYNGFIKSYEEAINSPIVPERVLPDINIAIAEEYSPSPSTGQLNMQNGVFDFDEQNPSREWLTDVYHNFLTLNGNVEGVFTDILTGKPNVPGSVQKINRNAIGETRERDFGQYFERWACILSSKYLTDVDEPGFGPAALNATLYNTRDLLLTPASGIKDILSTAKQKKSLFPMYNALVIKLEDPKASPYKVINGMGDNATGDHTPVPFADFLGRGPNKMGGSLQLALLKVYNKYLQRAAGYKVPTHNFNPSYLEGFPEEEEGLISNDWDKYSLIILNPGSPGYAAATGNALDYDSLDFMKFLLYGSLFGEDYYGVRESPNPAYQSKYPRNLPIVATGDLGDNASDTFSKSEIQKLYTNSRYSDVFEKFVTSTRTLGEILKKPSKATSETIGYRIEKIDKKTGEVEGNFYCAVDSEMEFLHYIDTRVKQSKMYTYNIYAQRMVFGTKYYYRGFELNGLTGDTYTCGTAAQMEQAVDKILTQLGGSAFGFSTDNMSPVAQSDQPNASEGGINWDITTSLKIIADSYPCMKIFELPYYTTEMLVRNKPPMAPEVELVPYKSVNNKLLINFRSTVGGPVYQTPIAILESDGPVIQKYYENQKTIFDELTLKATDKIQYVSDDPPSAFEIFRTEVPPESYGDFRNAEFYKKILLEDITSDGFRDTLKPNTKYYYIFRMADIHGNISNPTAIHEVQLVSTDGITYLDMKLYDFKKLQPKTSIPARKLLLIKPALQQVMLNLEDSGVTPNENGEITIGGKSGQIKLGVADESIFDNSKKFKIRLTSKNSCKKLDINLSCTLKNVETTQQSQITETC